MHFRCSQLISKHLMIIRCHSVHLLFYFLSSFNTIKIECRAYQTWRKSIFNFFLMCYYYSVCVSHGWLASRLEESGYSIGQKIIELYSCRERLTKRETRIVNMLQVDKNKNFCLIIFINIVCITVRVERNMETAV